MKKLLLFALTFWVSLSLSAQEIYHDSTALMILDKMGEYIGELNSVKFKTKTSQDVAYSDDFFIKEYKTSEIIFQGPNRFASKIRQHDTDHFYYYNGSQMVYYSMQGNFHTVADAPETSLETLDWLKDEFGIEVVATYFLYPNFTGDLTETMEYIEFLGEAELDGETFFHIGGANAEMTFQIWISQDLAMKPKKMVMTYFGEPYSRQLEIDFDSWEVNEVYPNSIFEFMPPPNSKQITWTSKN